MLTATCAALGRQLPKGQDIEALTAPGHNQEYFGIGLRVEGMIGLFLKT